MRAFFNRTARTVALAFKRRKKVEMTLEGKFLAAMAVALGVVAVNTGINLLYLVLSAILAFISISGIASEICLKGIKIDRSAPLRSACGEVVAVRLKIRNINRFFPAAAIYLEDTISSKRSRSSIKCFAPKIDRRGEATVVYKIRFDRRGCHDFGPIIASTQFPFGLFKKSLQLPKADQTIVLPACSAVDGRFLSRLIGLSEDHGQKKQILSGQGDFHALRDFRQGDNIKLVHWRSSAKLSKLMLRELEREENSHCAVLLNAMSPNGPSTDGEKDFEKAVSAAASLARYLIKKGNTVSYVPLGGRGGDFVGTGSGLDHLLKIMERLALVEQRAAAAPEQTIDEASRLIPNGSIAIAVGFEKQENSFETMRSKLAAKRVHLKMFKA